MDIKKRILIIVQNLPVTRDRRVWLEACALRDEGYDVSVVCPRGAGLRSYQELDGIVVRTYRPSPRTRGFLSYIWEFMYCWVRTSVLVGRASVREGFDAIQACNPPDTYWLLAAPFKLVGKRFIFDQHDLCPEVYASRFDGGFRVLAGALRLLERGSYATADHVIVTNESYRRTALRRGRVSEDRVTVIRSGPDPDRFRKTEPDSSWRAGRRYLGAYLGVMGPQDGVDLALRAISSLARSGRDDVQYVFMGTGDSHDELVTLASDLGIADRVAFTGWADDDMISSVLSTADIGLCPDPLSPLNDVSTMNKTLEYMAFALPMVSFDLRETRVSAEGAAVYVEPNDTDAFGRAIAELLDDPARREEMGKLGRRRIENELAWGYSARRYVAVYDGLFGAPASSREVTRAARAGLNP